MARGFEGSFHVRRLRAPSAAGAVLYVHGLGESGLCFERVMADPRLADWAHLAVDLEGYGKSLWAAEPFALDEHAQRLARLIDRLSLESVVVVGHSMGGVIGTLLCERLAGTARGFVNVEGNLSLPDCGYSGRAVEFSLEAWLDHGFDRVLDAIHHEGESAGVRLAYIASILMCDPRAYHRNSRDLVELSRAEGLAARLAALDAPTVYVHGAPRGTGERSLGLLERAGVERIRIDGAGHWPFLDQHDAFVEALAGFLARLPPASGEP